ncbi:hypothetical protein CBL_09659 [Carabus blaptoides fortunei]
MEQSYLDMRTTYANLLSYLGALPQTTNRSQQRLWTLQSAALNKATGVLHTAVLLLVLSGGGADNQSIGINTAMAKSNITPGYTKATPPHLVAVPLPSSEYEK